MSGRLPASWVRIVMACAMLAVAASLLSPLAQERRLKRAEQALATGEVDRAVALSRDVDGRGVRERAQRVRAIGALRQGDLVTAEREFAEAVATTPNSWSLRLDHAVVLRRLGRVAAARAELGRALGLNPGLMPPSGFTVSAGPGR